MKLDIDIYNEFCDIYFPHLSDNDRNIHFKQLSNSLFFQRYLFVVRAGELKEAFIKIFCFWKKHK